LEQVEDTRNALTWLAQHAAVDPARIALVGSSFGGAVSVYTGGVDERVAAVSSKGGRGGGEGEVPGADNKTRERGGLTPRAGGGTGSAPQDGKVFGGPAIRLRPVPAAPARQSRQGLASVFPSRDRPEHVRFPRR